ncbi:RNA polymerase sigma factor, partial [Microbispora rosea]
MEETLEFRLAAGDAGAIGECYRMHSPAVRSYLYKLVPPQDVEDVLQVVFTEVWRFRHRFDPARSLSAWLFGIARNRAVSSSAFAWAPSASAPAGAPSAPTER